MAWFQTSTKLKFLFGELVLGSADIPSLVWQEDLSRLNSDEQVAPRYEALTKDLSLLLMRSAPLKEAVPRVSILPQAIRYVPNQYRRYFVRLEGSFEDYLLKFSKKRRHELGREVRKFTRFCGDELKWREFAAPDEMEEFLALARAVAAKTYQERLWGKGIPSGPEYLQDLVAAAGRDEIRGYILFHQDRPVVYSFFQATGDVLVFQFTGYDPEYAKLSPGTVLLYLILEKSFTEHRFRLLDFTEGSAWYKESFSTDHIDCADIYYFRRSVNSLLLVGLHNGLSGGSRLVASALDRLHLKTRLKKLIRSKA